MSPLKERAQRIHQINVEHGFWPEGRNVNEALMLVISEFCEALEDHRDGKPAEYFTINGQTVYPVRDGSGADWTTNTYGMAVGETYTGVRAKPCGVVSELADAAIRALDLIWKLYGNAADWPTDEQVNHAVQVVLTHQEIPDFVVSDNFAECLLEICQELDETDTALLGCVLACVTLTGKFYPDANFWEILDRKVEYNASRPYKHNKAY